MRILTGTIAFAAAIGGSLLMPMRSDGQGSYSIETANEFVRARDWNGLLRYATDWTRARPKDPMGWFYLGNTWGMGLNRPDQALPAFQNAVALKSTWPEAWNALGHVNVQLKRYEEAAEAFTHAVQQAPGRPNYWNNLAAAYSYANRLSRAVETLEAEQRATASTLSFAEWYNLANGFLTMQEFRSAANAYRQTIRLKPDYGPAWNNLGTLEGVLGNTAAALDDYKRAAALGDELGAGNYAKLQRAIAAAQEARSDNPLKALWREQAADAEYRARRAWQERLERAQG